MKLQHIIFTIFFIASAPLCLAQVETAEDELALLAIKGVEVTAIKQGKNLRHEALSSIVVDEIFAQEQHIESMKDLSAIAPNFYIPNYGSKITSSVYARGLGARIDQPAVGLTVDNVPYLNKNAFDVELMDIARMEVLNGPQSTLYGRNTLAGMVNIYTLSPMEYQGIRLGAEYANGESYRLRASIYKKASDKFAYSVGGYFNSSDGFFTNEYTGELVDWERDKGGKLRLQFNPSSRSIIDFNSSLSVLEQGGYAYRQLSTNEINYNTPSGYDRTLLSNGLSIVRSGERFTFSSITSHQWLDDEMRLDNDFTQADIFKLTQSTKENSFTQDFVLRQKADAEKKFSYLVGIFGFYRDQKMQAPVEFRRDGIKELILVNANDFLPNFGLELAWADEEFTLSSDFNTKSWGAASYGEATLDLGRFEIKGSLRFDYETSTLDYHSYTQTTYIAHNLDEQTSNNVPLNISLEGSPTQNFAILVPKISLKYKLNNYNSLYANVTRGYKAGGFNTQMFSDILREKLMSDIMGTSLNYEIEDIIKYDPETSINYEIGAKLADNNGKLSAQVALFYINCFDQQLTTFREGSTGRMMSNAGETRSFGAELSARWRFSRFTANGSYGYTNAKFKEYNDGKNDYSGKYVPYAPQQTLFASLAYEIPLNLKVFEKIEIEANTNGVGRIYWNESNTRSQDFYALLGANIRFEHKKYSLNIWGKNLADKSYDTFYFLSMDREFMQAGLAATYGITLNYKL